MTTGTRSKGTEGLLKVAIALCVLFSLANLAGLIYSHVPPYEVGECFSAPRQGVTAKIESNDVLGGYSIVSTSGNQKGPVAFTELRHPSFTKVECK